MSMMRVRFMKVWDIADVFALLYLFELPLGT